MKARMPDLEVPQDNPFQYDVLDRKQVGETLTEFVARVEQPYVLAIDSAWGTGKTTFLRMWRQSLIGDGFPTLYFNAWETDFASDPFVALVGELSAAVEDLSNDSTAEEFLKKARQVAIHLGKKAVPLLARLATSGLLNLDGEIEGKLASLAE